MQLSGGPTTGTFRLKALWLFLKEQRGAEAAQRFEERIGGQAVVEDETRPLARQFWFRAVEEWVRLAGPGALLELGPYLVHPDCLGAWSRLLRGVQDPNDILQKLGASSEILPGDTFWIAEKLSARSWKVKIALSGTESEVQREQLRAVFQAELAALPTLLGLPPARVQVLCEEALFLEFRFQWSPAGRSVLLVGAAFCLLWFCLAWVWLLSLEKGSPFLQWWSLPIVLLGPPGIGALLSWFWYRDSLRQTQTVQQRVRILALEREAILRQTRSKEISRPHEEPIIAGQYRVGAQLGTGATGAVWEATRLTDGGVVALKLLRSSVAHDARATDRLRREAEALGLSWHPHVVEVLDSGVLSSGVGFLVMQRLYGETLAERLGRRGRLSPEEARQVGLQVADALFAIHSAGVVHRDIKPGNLFFHQTEEGKELVKVIDFGVAKISWAETRLTRSGVRIGTLGYASPEQEAGQEVDGRTDIYALGICLREMLSGISPTLEDRPEDSWMTLSLPSAWREVLQRMTALDPADRFVSARDLRLALLSLGADSSDGGHEGDVLDWSERH